MSGLFVELWLNDLIPPDKLKSIDALVSQIGSNTNSSKRTWADLAKEVKLGPVRPIDKILQMSISDSLRAALVELRTIPQSPANVYGYTWSFDFSDSSALEGAPSAEKYKCQETYPSCLISIENEPFRLLSGWGTSEFSSQAGILEKTETLDKIVNYFGRLPRVTAMLVSRFPLDTLLAGYLVYWIISQLGGYLVIRSRTINTPEDLEKLYEQVLKEQFQGRIWRFITSDNPEYTWYVVDNLFLKSWLTHPTFNLF